MADTPSPPSPTPRRRHTSATLYAIGAYAPALASCMDYPDLFEAVPTGTSVCVALAHAFEEDVLELASFLAIDPWSPEQHHLDPSRIDAAALERAEYSTVEIINLLRAADFSFHFVLEPDW